MTKKFSIVKNQSGQTIASIVMIMIVALSVSVAISARFFKTLRQASRTDSANRSLAVAEALVENLLSKDYQTLQDYIDFNSCGTECVLQIVGDDGVEANATATLTRAGNSSEPFEIEVTEDSLVEVSLDGYPDDTPVYVCWDVPGAGELPSLTGALLKGVDGDYSIDAYSYNSIGSIHADNGFSDATSQSGFDNCFSVDSSTSPKALRVKSIYNGVTAYIIPEGGANLPSQGILISSTGTVEEAERTVEVLMSTPYMPAPFDYVIYHYSSDYPLSN